MFPCNIFQTWKNYNIPVEWQKNQKTWKKLHKNWKYVLHSDYDNEAFILSKCPDLIDIYKQLPQAINRVDYIRYVYLYYVGGVYADLDCECINSLDPLLEKETKNDILLGLVPDGQVDCAFMISKPHHPFWLDVLKEIETRLFHPSYIGQLQSLLSSSLQTLHLTGPCLLQSMVEKCKDKYKIKLFPAEYFFPKSWHNTSLTDRSYITNRTYVVHHGAGSWLTSSDQWFCNGLKFIQHYYYYIIILVWILVMITLFRKKK